MKSAEGREVPETERVVLVQEAQRSDDAFFGDMNDPEIISSLHGQDAVSESLLKEYGDKRDFPALPATSRLSVHLRFGTVSIRQLARTAYQRSLENDEGAAIWLSELVWRDFYHQILYHHPHVVQRAFKPEYDRIEWAQGPQAEAHWQAPIASRPLDARVRRHA